MVETFGLKTSDFLISTNDCLNDNGIKIANSMSMHARVKHKAPSYSNFDLTGHFYEYGWSNFLETFTNGIFDHKMKMIQDHQNQHSMVKI